MPPKKRDKDDREVGPPRNGKIDTFLQNDHELFLQAFEKPTQIYRYLRTRNMISPIFLNRTLTYMKGRTTRNNTGRSKFKVDGMLCQKMTKIKSEKLHETLLGDYITLMFMGFYDKNLSEHLGVKVETILVKISHKKRKDSSSAIMQFSIGTSDVKINPDENNQNKISAVSISADSFKPIVGPMTRSYILLLRVQTYPIPLATNNAGDEPANKKFKGHSKLYGSELVIFDKHGRCLLTEGEYVLALEEIIQTPKQTSPKKLINWETIPESALEDIDKTYPFEAFDKCPTLKFRLIWTKEATTGIIENLLPLPLRGNSDCNASNKENHPMEVTNNNNNKMKQPMQQKDMLGNINADEKMQIVYQFIYNNNSRQQTEACADFHCPWCSLNCVELYPLLKHLKLCHSRFTFTLSEIENGSRIDVAINELYDGSYTGSPHDLVGQSGYAFSRAGPIRRTSVTNLLVCRPRRSKPTLTEFVEVDETTELNNQRPFITGHNRLYHHTVTCLPVHPKELDIDSEGESDPQWLQQKTMMMIDEFTDVNEGEKELMKMWNLHVMKYGYVGDCQIPLACDMFLGKKGRELLQKNLYRNFILHLCSLFDYGLISPDVFYKNVQKLQKQLGECQEAKNVMTETRGKQMKFWLTVGMHKQNQQLNIKPEPSLKLENSLSLQSKKVVKKEKEEKFAMTPPLKKLEPNSGLMRRKSIIPKIQSKENAIAGSIMSRRISILKDHPQRRRSAGSTALNDRSDVPKRRKSIAIPAAAPNARKRC